MSLTGKTMAQGLGRFLTLVVLALNLLNCFDVSLCAEVPPTYFAGLDLVDRMEEFPSSCVKVCTGSDFVARIDNGNCYCHTAPPVKCKPVRPVAAGDTSSVDDGSSAGVCEAVGHSGFRTKVDTYACKVSGQYLCVLKDYLEDLPASEVNTPFGGQNVLFSCRTPEVDFCKTLCGEDNFAACQFFKFDYQCFCHAAPPTDSDGYACTGPDMITSSSTASGGSSDEDKCHDVVVDGGFTVDLYLYTCSKAGNSLVCVVSDVSPPADMTTTTTTEASISGGGGCDICKGGFLLSFIACPVLCLVFGVVNFIKLLLSGLISKIGAILNAVPSLLGEVINEIGGLLE